MKIKNQILLVVNPISGGIDKSKLIEAVKSEINIRNYSLEIYKTSDNNDQDSIEKLIFEFPVVELATIVADVLRVRHFRHRRN
jgi:diacylglycerol kinase family enzyme